MIIWMDNLSDSAYVETVERESGWEGIRCRDPDMEEAREGKTAEWAAAGSVGRGRRAAGGRSRQLTGWLRKRRRQLGFWFQ